MLNLAKDVFTKFFCDSMIYRNIVFKNVVITKQKKEYWNVMDLNVLFVQKEKKKKIASPKQHFSNADAGGDAVPR